MNRIRKAFAPLGWASLAWLVAVGALLPATAHASGRAIPKEGDAPALKVESPVSFAASGSAARTRSSSSSSHGSASRGSSGHGSSSHGTASRGTATRSPSSASRTRSWSGDRSGGRGSYNPGHYRGHYPSGHRYPYGYHYHYPRYNFYLGYYYPYDYFWYWPWGGYWGGYWGAGPYYYPPYRGRYSEGEMGALDLDISPEKAEVWLDGQYIGVADNFDGYPDYLWLDPGTYDLVFYKEGFRTIQRQYTIHAGLVVDVEDRMTPGESIPPQQLASQSTVHRDERLRRDAERQEMARREPEAMRRPAPSARQPLDARGEPGRLRLTVTPADASVYLDGRFLGTAEELAKLHSGLIVDPGEHRLEVVRPGYDSDNTSFDVASGEEVSVQVDLKAD